MTLRSVEMFTEYEPGATSRFISPTPLLMVVAVGDHLTVADEALAAYERALEPKKLVSSRRALRRLRAGFRDLFWSCLRVVPGALLCHRGTLKAN